MEPEEALEIARLTKGKRYLEVGTAAGYSALVAAAAGAIVSAVDYWIPDDSNENGRGTQYPDFLANVRAHDLSVRDYPLTSAEAFEELADQEFDVVLIDGRHDKESVMHDVIGGQKLLAPGGTLLCHDYDEEHTGVVAALAALFPEGPDYTVQSLWVGTI